MHIIVQLRSCHTNCWMTKTTKAVYLFLRLIFYQILYLHLVSKSITNLKRFIYRKSRIPFEIAFLRPFRPRYFQQAISTQRISLLPMSFQVINCLEVIGKVEKFKQQIIFFSFMVMYSCRFVCPQPHNH